MKKWTENFQWHFIAKAFGKVKKLDNEDDMVVARNLLRGLNRNGVLSNPPTKDMEKLRDKILEFVAQK